MNIVGSSSLSSFATGYSITGPTGPTGYTGPKGPTGTGITGSTGSDIVGISFVDRLIFTKFSDGSTYSTTSIIYGATGPSVYSVAFSNLGSGISLAAAFVNIIPFLGGDTVSAIAFRGITFINNSNGKLIVTKTTGTPGKYEINLQVPSGISLISSSSNQINLLKFNSSGILERVTKTEGVTVNNAALPTVNSIKFINANVFEHVRGFGWTGSTGAVNCQVSSGGITCSVNPFVFENDSLMFGSRSKVYAVNFNGNNAKINLPGVPIDSNLYSFDLFVSNANNQNITNNAVKGFSSNIKWAGNKAPCFSVSGTTCSYKVTFLGLNGQWYGTVSSINTPCLTKLFNDNCTNTSFVGFLSSTPQITGACCRSDGTCQETFIENCDGYFQGIGTTCGSTIDSVCNKPGVCCKKTVVNGVESIYGITDELTCSDCLALSEQNVKFAGNYTTLDTTNCYNVFNDIGACCDGRGNCSELNRSDCDVLKGYYQGTGTVCYNSLGDSICSTGTGPCCVNGSCSENSYLSCYENNGFYLGKNKQCSQFVCPSTTTCLGFIDGVPIYQGAQYGGGVVVGSYTPGNTEILGSKELFSLAGYSFSTDLILQSTVYKSELDHYAYGLTSDCSVTPSYIIIVYPHDIAVDENFNIKNPDTEFFVQQVFAWGGTGSSWGPITNNSGEYNDFTFDNYDYRTSHLQYSEGYWSTGFTGTTQAYEPVLLNNTFTPCSNVELYGNGAIQKEFAKSPYNIHGMWSRSWGMYNTIRAVSAYNAYYSKTYETLNYYSYSDFNGLTGVNAFTVIKSINDGLTSSSQGITANNYSLSPWFLPSHDEMAFIAVNTIPSFGFNINSVLFGVGQPLNGTYWTSTGTFNYNKLEGIYDGNNRPIPGSVAIAINIDANADLYNYKVIKKSRQEKARVRPIRMLRCDGLIPADTRFWNIPNILK